MNTRASDPALKQGINFFNAANTCGGQRGEGSTEQIVGRWPVQGNGRWERMVLATKVYGEMGELSALHIRQALERR